MFCLLDPAAQANAQPTKVLATMIGPGTVRTTLPTPQGTATPST
jgi:hypothetical protein